ncbi:DUF2796 domain-containing protein [Reinekea sp. G2M2-21]|uniref:ZrgA family zinc uptake protein n=1 Tax=Reinekea sp. G2M2-21 TaxID=2788942 RepID=UPI0018AC45B4|nr:DUF2796 domain-containing protein [Reinekea sp. G2M2-21]
MKNICLICLVFSTATPLFADEDRQHTAHEHGAATLGIAQDQNTVLLELNSPAFNIFGFEHKPNNQTDKDLIAASVAQLQRGHEIFLFPEAAKCSVRAMDIHSSLLDEEHEEHEESDEHESEHSNVQVAWTATCEHSSQLNRIDIKLFSFFPNLTDLDVDYLMDSGQGAAELNAMVASISF